MNTNFHRLNVSVALWASVAGVANFTLAQQHPRGEVVFVVGGIVAAIRALVAIVELVGAPTLPPRPPAAT
jgi:hypothetical protein